MADGPLEIDFGNIVDVVDFLKNEKVGADPKLTLTFRKGETRIFQTR